MLERVYVQMFFSDERNCDYLRLSSPRLPESPAPYCQRWKPRRATFRYPRLRKLQPLLIAALQICLPPDESGRSPMPRYPSAGGRRARPSSKAKTFGRQPTKPITPGGTRGRTWRDEYHPAAAREVLALSSSAARTTRIRSAVAKALQSPYLTEKKRGRLKGCRAIEFTIGGVTYRGVYEIDETRRVLYFLAVGPHDVAYERAERRI